MLLQATIGLVYLAALDEVSIRSSHSTSHKSCNFFVLYFQDPFKLPTVSEQVINDMKSDGFTFQTPPSSPSNNSSLGSRKSSMCSISSAGSNSTNGSPSHHVNSMLKLALIVEIKKKNIDVS